VYEIVPLDGFPIHSKISLLTMADLSTTLAGIRLPSCVYNASGPRSGTSAALRKVAESKSGGEY
jgi:hypothetical protein